MWQQLRQHRAEIPARLEAQRTRSSIASLEPPAQVEQHELSSRDIKLDLAVALSYETDIILEHRGERNVPRRYLKEARWDAHNEPDGTINLGYFAQDRDGNFIAVDFDFNTLTWGTTHRTRKGKYRLTIPAPIELGLRIVDEERAPRSDWGEIDRAKNRENTPDEQSEEEEIDSPRTPAAGNTDEETELQKIAESIPTPTNLQPGNLFAPSIFTPSAFMASTTQTTTQVQPPPTVPLSSSAGKTTAGGSGPPGGGGGQGVPNPLNNPFGPPGGGNPGGGGGNPGGGGGNPGGGGGGNPNPPHDKLSGQQPTIFDGDRQKSEAFMQEWNIYWGINRFTPQMVNPFSRVLMFLSFIKGDKVHEWTQAQLRWAVDYVAQAPGNDNHEYLWDTVADAFFRAFTNITREVDAQTNIKTLKMKGDHGLDDYISTFERLARLGGYNLADKAVIDMFVDGLPNSLAINVAKFNTPRSFDEWKRGAVEHHTTYLWIKSRFHNKKSETRPTQDQWKRVFTKKGDDAMDTTPGRVKARATNTRPPLNDEECEKLRKEGRCFRCRKQGHLSRYCPEKPSQARGNPQEEDSENETIQATTSKPPPKQTNPFLVKKKTTAQDIIRLITDAEDDVKDTIIQEVFMKQDF